MNTDSRGLKIAIVVHGRFHALDLARELGRQGADVIVLTNYPRSIVARFGVPEGRVLSCLGHGVLARLVHCCAGSRVRRLLEPGLHRWFSRWAARRLKGQPGLDAIHSFSGVSEEIFREFPSGRPLRSLVRGSAHILAQAGLLAAEQTRCGRPLDQPSPWMIARELREYELSDVVVVLSSFAARTFLEAGFPREKLRTLPLGSDLSRFRPKPDVVRERCRRILTGDPLRVLTVGSFAYQKGMYDLAGIARALAGQFQFTFVGDCPRETAALRSACRRLIKFVPRQPQTLLSRYYAEGDVFVFPTIQDGYAAVLAQAHASGLPILTTENCAGKDLIHEGQTGWVLPIRAPEAFIGRLHWCDANRDRLAEIARDTYSRFQARDWSEVASDLLRIFRGWIDARRAG